MLGKALLFLVALSPAPAPDAAGTKDSASVPDAVETKSRDAIKPEGVTPPGSETGGQSYGDRNRGGPYGFYSYPRHRHVDGRVSDRGLVAYGSGDASHSYDGNYGSAYYGRNYGAPYHGGGYYDGGTYYKERFPDRR